MVYYVGNVNLFSIKDSTHDSSFPLVSESFLVRMCFESFHRTMELRVGFKKERVRYIVEIRVILFFCSGIRSEYGTILEKG
jgi:hypothetical protein